MAIVTGVAFGCTSLHPCLNSIAPMGLAKRAGIEGVITDMPWHVRDRTTLLNGLHRPVHGMSP